MPSLSWSLYEGLVAPDLGILVKDFYFSVSGFSCNLNLNIFHSVVSECHGRGRDHSLPPQHILEEDVITELGFLLGLL